MANVLNRTTKQYLRSVNDPLYPVEDWIHNPDLTLVQGEPTKYWVITGDIVTLMTPAQQAAVDAQEAADQQAANRAAARSNGDQPPDGERTERALIHLANKRDNYLLNRIVELQDALTAMKATSGGADNVRGAIPSSFMASNTRPLSDAVQDFKDEIDAGNAD